MTEWHPLRPYNNGNDNYDDDDDDDDDDDKAIIILWNQLDKSAVDRGRAIAKSSPAKMPTMDHSSMADYEYVYAPSDDTYLLIDAIKYDLFSGYPAVLLDGGGDGDGDGDGYGDDKEKEEEKDETISRVALEFHYQRTQLQMNRDDEEKEEEDKEEGEKEKERIQDLVKNGGYNASQSLKILSRLEQLKRLDRIQAVMEIGTGSGIPITYLSKRLLMEKPRSQKNDDDDDDSSNKGFSVIATDLNPLALEFAQRTAEENGVVKSCNDDNGNDNGNDKVKIQKTEFVECDLATPLLKSLQGTIDVLVFNPPYVPTEDSEICGNGIEISWAGGQNGRRIIDLALPQIASLLKKPDGVCYMITVDDNLPRELAAILKTEHQLQMIPLLRRRARNEYLSVQKISWL